MLPEQEAAVEVERQRIFEAKLTQPLELMVCSRGRGR